MSLLTQVGILLASIFVLAKSSEVVASSAVKIARVTRLSELVVGFIILAVATNLPELSIAISSLISREVAISLGNIFGSNITDLLFVIGIASLTGVIQITKKTHKELSTILLVFSIIPLLLLSKFYSPKLVGSLLIFTFLYFVYHLVRERITHEEIRQHHERFELSKIVIFCLSLFFVVYSSKFVISSASKLALFYGASEAVIGATIISIGTTLPELAVSLQAIRRRHFNLALGNVIGSCLIKITLLLGLVLVFNPQPIDFGSYSILIVFTILSSVIIWIFLNRSKLMLFDGIFLLLVYIIFLVLTLTFSLF
ncbi:MAG: sodium:calcium antiporter [Candidatus Aenigmatarchaeota archaeon]